MSLEIKVGPPQLAIHQGHAVLLTAPDGQIKASGQKGLYFYDTRVISSWTVYANGEPWDLLNGGTTTSFTARIFLANRALATEAGSIAPRTVGLMLSRHIGGGVHEDLDLVNYGRSTVRFNLEIAVRSDFADLFEVKSGHFVRRGHITTKWFEQQQRLVTAYRNQDFSREVAMTARNNGVPAVYANGRLTFDVELPPGGHWHSCITYDLSDGEQSYRAPDACTRHDRETSGTANGSQTGSARCSNSIAATTVSGVCFVRQLTTWRHCACPLMVPTTCNLCRPPVCRGSWRCSDVTA